MERKVSLQLYHYFSPRIVLVCITILGLGFSNVSGGTRLPCPVTWIPDGHGYFPENAVSAGVGNYVTRIVSGVPNKLYGGHLNLEDGAAYAVDDLENAINSETYMVLTNPYNCSLEWLHVKASSGILPPNLVKVEDTEADSDASYIGRGPFQSTFRSGGTLRGGSILHGAYEQKVYKFAEFEILQSEQPSLRVHLSKFEFTLDLVDIETNSKPELFSIDHIVNEYKERIVFSLMSEGVVEEYFELKEDVPIPWVGVSTVNLNMKLWCGSPIVKDDKICVDHGAATMLGLGVRTERERTLRIFANLSTLNLESSAACSFGIMLEDYDVPFRAVGKFYSDYGQNKIGREQIKAILLGTGRDGATFVDVPDDGVQADITGWLTGKFVLRTKLLTPVLNRPIPTGYGPCDDHLDSP